MARHFNTILIPVDFSPNTDVAVSKALNLCRQNSCTIHLLHILQPGPGGLLAYVKYLFRGYSQQEIQSVMGSSEDRLEYIKSYIGRKREDITVCISVCYSEHVEETITKKAADLNADLVILGKHSAHRRFPRLNTVVAGRIAQQSGIPVLTVKPGGADNEMKSVVIPVGSAFPASKLAVVESLQCMSDIEIILVVFPYSDDAETFSKETLLSTFKTLKRQSAHPVRYIVLQGKNKARSLLTYCNEVGADMLIVNPGKETTIDNWMKSPISDFLPAGSRTSILAVRPR